MIALVRLGLLLAPLLVAGGPAVADGFTPPEGCSAYLTVQTMGCRVENHFTCDAAPGHRWRVDHDAEGPSFTARIDAEAQWVESRSLLSGLGRQTVFPAQDPASMTVLLEEGYDDFTFEERHSDGSVLRVEGFDRLTGDEVEIDGERLLRTQFRYRIIDPQTGALVDMGEGREFVSPVHRRFFSGVTVYQTEDGPVQFDRSPVQFAYPGEPGFGATDPIFGCGEMMSALPRSRSAS